MIVPSTSSLRHFIRNLRIVHRPIRRQRTSFLENINLRISEITNVSDAEAHMHEVEAQIGTKHLLLPSGQRQGRHP